MPIILAGNGSVSGVSSMPTAIGFGSTLSTAPQGINYASLPTGSILQIVNYQTGTYATGTTLIPYDNTIPQNTEGTEFMTLSITPKLASSKLLINVVILGGHSVSTAAIIAALFQDSNANALATMNQPQAGIGTSVLNFNYYMTAGTTSSTTFKVRGGSNSAGTFYFNGYAGAAYFGGALVSSITITEIAA